MSTKHLKFKHNIFIFNGRQIPPPPQKKEEEEIYSTVAQSMIRKIFMIMVLVSLIFPFLFFLLWIMDIINSWMNTGQPRIGLYQFIRNPQSVLSHHEKNSWSRNLKDKRREKLFLFFFIIFIIIFRIVFRRQMKLVGELHLSSFHKIVHCPHFSQNKMISFLQSYSLFFTVCYFN